MAGSQDPNENPVAINVVPMVDVIFCLCVFFMCSFKFKQLEGKFDSWLPKDKGSQMVTDPSSVIEEVRVAMFWDPKAEKCTRQLRHNIIESDDELQRLIKDAHDDFVKINKPDTPVIIDADPRVPWRDVVNVMNIIKKNKIDKIEFALGAKK